MIDLRSKPIRFFDDCSKQEEFGGNLIGLAEFWMKTYKVLKIAQSKEALRRNLTRDPFNAADTKKPIQSPNGF
jgi:hypothetical protein